MTHSQLQKRQAAFERHDAALERWPDRAGTPFTDELASVVADLEQVASKSNDSNGDRLERSRTYRYLGDAYFDLARGKDRTLLEKGSKAYALAEHLLQALGNDVERAKLDFNYANTLRGLGAGTDRVLMEEAKTRYVRALAVFEKEYPQFVSQVTRSLQSLEAQLSLLGLHEEARTNVGRLESIKQNLVRGDDRATEESEREAKRQLKQLTIEGRGVSAVRRDFEQIMETLKELKSESGPMLDPTQLQALAGAFTQEIDTASSRGTESEVFRSLFRVLKERYRADAASEKVTKWRQRSLEPLLDELEDLLDTNPEVPADIMKLNAKLRELIARIIPLLARPSYGKESPKPGTRAVLLLDYFPLLKFFIATEINRPSLGSLEKRTGTDLLTRLTQAGSDLLDAPRIDSDTQAVEREVLRQLSADIGMFARRRHMALAKPLWASLPSTLDPNLVFFSSGSKIAKIAKALKNACQRRCLTIADKTINRDIGQARWDDLRRSAVSVFDLTVEAGPPLAAVCFETGIALVLGKPMVILAQQGSRMPFDIEVQPYWIRDDEGDAEIIGEAVDNALYGIARQENDSSVPQTIDHVKRLVGANASFNVTHTLKLIEEAKDDPVEVNGLMSGLQGFLGIEGTYVLYPAWPGSYPDPCTKRCFHIMPFRPLWANEVMTIAERACGSAEVQYIRGDRVVDPRVIRSIWDEICKATHVLVDLTDFNANVALELGMALTLGRQTLIVGQDDTVDKLFPSIAKLRVHRYALGMRKQKLYELIRRHVQQCETFV